MLNWRGEEVRDRVMLAAGRGINSVLADCVREAKGDAPRITATLQGGIQMRVARQVSRSVVAGMWGIWNVKYALAVILGTRPHVIRPRRKKALYWPGADHPVKSVQHPGTRGRDFVRPVADRLYPQLPERIRRELG